MATTLSLRGKLLLLASSLVFIVLLGLAGELVCRLAGSATLMGNSRNLFTAAAYGASKGNTPNVEAISFNEPVFTDGNGFRVPASYDERSGQGRPALLVLGDSVAFGPGVAEEQTFAGLLRQSLAGQQVYNSAVVGYGVSNYQDVVNEWLPMHPEVQRVLLLYCLNDVSLVSASNIDKALAAKPASNVVESAKNIGLINGLNGFLRSRSMLYLTIRNVLTDPQKRYWKADLKNYGDPDVLARTRQKLVDLADSLKQRGIPFLVVIAPYEYQLRDGVDDEELDLPQREIVAILDEAGIEHVDALPFLRERGDGSKFFLVGDPMHFAEPGHQALHDLTLDRLGPISEPRTWPKNYRDSGASRTSWSFVPG